MGVNPLVIDDFSVKQRPTSLRAMTVSGLLRTCSGGKNLVCFYHESGPNRSRAGGGCTEKKLFRYSQIRAGHTALAHGQYQACF